jgi:hypothetical protein
MSSSRDVRREQPLAEETTKNLRAPRAPARSGVVERVEHVPETTPLVPIAVTEIAPPPSRDPRRD